MAAVGSQRVREGGIALTAHMTEPKLHHTIGSLMQVGINSVSTSTIEIPAGRLSTTHSRTLNAVREMVYHAAGEGRRSGVAARN